MAKETGKDKVLSTVGRKKGSGVRYYVTLGDIAETLGVTRQSIHNAISRGALDLPRSGNGGRKMEKDHLISLAQYVASRAATLK